MNISVCQPVMIRARPARYYCGGGSYGGALTVKGAMIQVTDYYATADSIMGRDIKIL
jgi:hypothetical protein